MTSWQLAFTLQSFYYSINSLTQSDMQGRQLKIGFSATKFFYIINVKTFTRDNEAVQYCGGYSGLRWDSISTAGEASVLQRLFSIVGG